ncbi:MAG: hypothetical protein PF961_17445 [Planctomycetota bacterium]|jgi:hypothetical protein|nr:hypothetical protein [Planctomycetota bacterium]
MSRIVTALLAGILAAPLTAASNDTDDRVTKLVGAVAEGLRLEGYRTWGDKGLAVRQQRIIAIRLDAQQLQGAVLEVVGHDERDRNLARRLSKPVSGLIELNQLLANGWSVSMINSLDSGGEQQVQTAIVVLERWKLFITNNKDDDK